jgi:hypothetical protein
VEKPGSLSPAPVIPRQSTPRVPWLHAAWAEENASGQRWKSPPSIAVLYQPDKPRSADVLWPTPAQIGQAAKIRRLDKVFDGVVTRITGS